jgi:hypothetical protein
LLRGGPRRNWKFGAAALVGAVVLAGLVVGLPGQQGCGGQVGSLPARADQVLPCDTPPPEVAAGSAKTHVFLARDGVTLTAGADDATKNVSQVLATKGLATLEVPVAGYDAAMWKNIESCLRQRFATFDIDFTTERPAAGPYVMAVFGGTGAALGFGAEIKGTAPIDSVGCKTSPSAVAFVFSAQLGASPELHCEIAAQEIAHAFSADHVMLAEDAMSYVSAGTAKTFRDAAAPCGEFSERACVCGRPSQNSYQLLLERLGPARASSDAAPPSVSATWQRSRGDSANITVAAVDDRAVASVQLTVESAAGVIRSTCGDGKMTCTPGVNGWTFQVTGAGEDARFSATAVDGVGNLSATAPETLSSTAAVGARVSAQVRVGAGRKLWVSALATGASSVTGATLEWTDATGTAKHSMCSGPDGRFFLPLAADENGAVREFSVTVLDGASPVAKTAAQQLALP